MKKSWGWGMIAFLIGMIVFMFVQAAESDRERTARLSTLPQMEGGTRITTGPHTSIHIREFDYEEKRCLWVTSSGHGTGVTCWDRKP